MLGFIAAKQATKGQPVIETLFDVDYRSGHSAWTGHFGFAQRLVAALEPKVIVELGAQYGDSYFCMVQLVDRLNTGTQCFAVDTWKGDNHSGIYSENVFAQVCGINEKYKSCSTLLRMPFDEASPLFNEAHISLLHIDGYHTYEAVKHDYETWNDKVSDVILFHDTNVFHKDFGVYKFWEELCEQFPTTTFEFAHSSGLGILCKTERAYNAVKIAIKQ